MRARGLRLVPFACLAGLPGCLTPLLWEGHDRETWTLRVHSSELHVTRAGVAGDDLVLAYRSPRPLPSPWDSELGEAGWLTLTGPADARAAQELLVGRSDLEVRRIGIDLVADRPDPLDLGLRAELVVEGTLPRELARRLSDGEAAVAVPAAAAVPDEPPPVLAACIAAVRRTSPWVLAAGSGVERGTTWEIAGFIGRDLLPLPFERLALEDDAEPIDHLGELSRVLLLLTAVDGEGAPVHLVVPADLAYLLQWIEVRMHPVPHFVHRSRWLPARAGRVPEDLRPLHLPIVLTASTRVHECVRSGGFWDTAWRVVLTPFTAVADGAIALGLGAGALAAVLSGDC